MARSWLTALGLLAGCFVLVELLLVAMQPGSFTVTDTGKPRPQPAQHMAF